MLSRNIWKELLSSFYRGGVSLKVREFVTGLRPHTSKNGCPCTEAWGSFP